MRLPALTRGDQEERGWAVARRRLSLRRVLALVPAFLLVLTALLPLYQEAPPAQAQGAVITYLETFGLPVVGVAPITTLPPSVHRTLYGNEAGATLIRPMNAQHGPECQGPEITHLVDANVGTFYICSGNAHGMTGINCPGTCAIYLTPDHLIDISAGTAIFRFDMSSLRFSARDWIDIWIGPPNTHLQAFGQDGIEPRDGIVISMENQNPGHASTAAINPHPGNTRFVGRGVFNNHVRTGITETDAPGYETFLRYPGDSAACRYEGGRLPLDAQGYCHSSAVQRETFEVQLSKTHLRVGMPTHNVWWIDTAISLDWNAGMIELNHRSYNPGKDEGPWCQPIGGCRATTWHYDNFYISPAIPFTFIDAQQEQALGGRTTTITFPQAAPADAELRFISTGPRTWEFSTDLGATFRRAEYRELTRYLDPTSWHWNAVTGIPAGTREIRVRNPSGIARDFGILSFGALAQATPTPTGTPTLTSTPTVTSTPLPPETAIPATATSVAATATSIVATATALASLTPAPPTVAPPTQTAVAATQTAIPPSMTAIAATATSVAATATAVAPTPTATLVPTPTLIPPICELAIWRGDDLIHGEVTECPQ